VRTFTTHPRTSGNSGPLLPSSGRRRLHKRGHKADIRLVLVVRGVVDDEMCQKFLLGTRELRFLLDSLRHRDTRRRQSEEPNFELQDTSHVQVSTYTYSAIRT